MQKLFLPSSIIGAFLLLFRGPGALGDKQLLLQPFFGGGLVTAAAVPLIFQTGPYPLLMGMTILFLTAVGMGLWLFGPAAREARAVKERRPIPHLEADRGNTPPPPSDSR